MGSTADVVKIKGDGSGSVVLFNRLSRLFLVDIPLVLVKLLSVWLWAELERTRGHMVDLVVNNDSQTKAIELDELWKRVE